MPEAVQGVPHNTEERMAYNNIRNDLLEASYHRKVEDNLTC